MNLFADAIEAHIEWKSRLRRQIEEGAGPDVKEIADCHRCELGRWIYGEGLRYNRLPAFESVCYNHEHFHRVAAEIAQYLNNGNREKALSLMSEDGIFSKSSNALIRALIECGKQLEGQ